MESQVMKIFLDDVREPEHVAGCVGFWFIVRDYNEAVEAFSLFTVKEATLDHDLGLCKHCKQVLPYEGTTEDHHNPRHPAFCEHCFKDQCNGCQCKTGYDLCKWLDENLKYWPENGIRVHSMNPVGRQRMQDLLARIKTKLTTIQPII